MAVLKESLPALSTSLHDTSCRKETSSSSLAITGTQKLKFCYPNLVIRHKSYREKKAILTIQSIWLGACKLESTHTA